MLIFSCRLSPPGSPIPLSPAVRRALPAAAQTALEVTLRELSIGMRAPTDRGIGVDLQVISGLIETHRRSFQPFLRIRNRCCSECR